MITGAAGGIGIGLCRHFIDVGAVVLAVDIDREALARLQDAAPSDRLHTDVVDLNDLADVRRSVDAFSAAQGSVEILINNAGAAAAMTLAELSPEAWRHDLAINLTAAYHCVEAVKDAMMAAGRGVIINIGSVNGLTALGHPAYSAAKAGLISYTRSLAIEYGPRGLRANIICPGTVRTQAWDERAASKPEIFASLQKWYPLRSSRRPRTSPRPLPSWPATMRG